MPRRSQAALAVAPLVSASIREPRIAAPAGLNEAERAAWAAIVNRLPATWFAKEQTGLVVAHVRHLVRADALAALLAGVDPVADWDRYAKVSRLALEETRAVFSTGRALRLTPQARTHPTTAAHRAAAAGAQSIDAILGGRHGD
jgi:hypothetical protein